VEGESKLEERRVEVSSRKTVDERETGGTYRSRGAKSRRGIVVDDEVEDFKS
jgi:hypothetical protein